jgi:hypothetical protein
MLVLGSIGSNIKIYNWIWSRAAKLQFSFTETNLLTTSFNILLTKLTNGSRRYTSAQARSRQQRVVCLPGKSYILIPVDWMWKLVATYVLYSYTEVGWGTMLQAGGLRVRFPDEVIGFFNWPNPFSRTMALGSTQPLTEMSTRNLPGSKGRPARGADNLTAICEPIV